MANSYQKKLLDPRWQKKRLEILQRDEFKCKYCGDEETTLHIHHKSYHGEPWEAPSELLITCCKHCHSVIEEYKNWDKFEFKKIIKLSPISESNLPTILYLFFKTGKHNQIDLFHFSQHDDIKDYRGAVLSPIIADIPGIFFSESIKNTNGE